MPTPVVFDIETGPVDNLREIVAPFDSSSVPFPGEFDPSAVKHGNTKDPAKRAAKEAEERAKHDAAVANYATALADAETAYWAEQHGKAALSAVTGRVLAIGYRGDKTVIDTVEEKAEETLLVAFWRTYAGMRKVGRTMIGYSIANFDVPFLAQRSWILGVDVPPTIYSGPGRFLEPTFVDLAAVWNGSGRSNWVKLDMIAKACGIQGKPNGINGGDFSRLFSNPDTRPEAIDYLIGDLNMTWQIASRVGLI